MSDSGSPLQDGLKIVQRAVEEDSKGYSLEAIRLYKIAIDLFEEAENGLNK